MNKSLKIANVIGSELRSRSKGDILRENISNRDYRELDMTGVSFVSRSFADELCNILEENNNLVLSNTSDVVKDIINIVSESRKHKRVRTKDNSEIKEFDNIDSLSEFLLTM